jgi:competence protein ComEA
LAAALPESPAGSGRPSGNSADFTTANAIDPVLLPLTGASSRVDSSLTERPRQAEPCRNVESIMRRLCVTSAIAFVLLLSGLSSDFNAQTASQSSPSAQPAAAALVNLNTATVADLAKLPGIGPAVAARIVEYRQKNGGFKKAEELMNVKGIGEKTFLKLKPLVTVAPPKTTER